MDSTVQEEIQYVIAVHGFAPEFWPAIAYRKEKSFEVKERQKEIKCPYCGRHLMWVSVSRKLELFRYPKKATVNCHEVRTCKSCHEKIGIIYSAA